MDKKLLQQFYSRYKKHLESDTLSIFWNELNKRDFKDHCIKEKTKKISYIKRHMPDYHHKHTSTTSRLSNVLKYNNNPDIPSNILENHIDPLQKDKFLDLKNRLMMYNDKMEDELNFMQMCGEQRNLYPYNALNTYVSVLQSLHDRDMFLHSLVNPLVAGKCDKIFINNNNVVDEPDIIGVTRNKYGLYDLLLIKITPYYCFDVNIIDDWKLKYGFSAEVVILDIDLIIKKPITLFKIWGRSDLIEICVRGEFNLMVNYKPYYFNQFEFIELIDQKKDNVDKIDLALSRINLNIQ